MDTAKEKQTLPPSKRYLGIKSQKLSKHAHLSALVTIAQSGNGRVTLVMNLREVQQGFTIVMGFVFPEAEEHIEQNYTFYWQ